MAAYRANFRDNLFSIFVDNLNLKVDYACLWGLFKPFGKVRDIYLSAVKLNRRSRFAFVRFGSLEEATKVAEKTNGMHVYSWPIATKIASLGWKNRSPMHEFQRNSENGSQKWPGKEYQWQESYKESSYADAVRGIKDRGFSHVENDKAEVVSMSWDFRRNDQVWLNRCSVGVLKNFKEVARVNRRLLDRGAEFTSAYLGDKCVLWVFESEIHKDRFIKDRGMWDDSFSSMVRWSDFLDVQARLVWINCWGVPISCWSSDFFMKLGWQIGEPLMVDAKTEDRVFVDKGRVLVLVPHHQKVSVKVKIVGGSRPFLVKLEEDPKLVETEWVESFLALRKEKSFASRSSTPEQVGESLQKSTSQVGMVMGDRGVNCQGGKAGKEIQISNRGLIGRGRLEMKSRGLIVKRCLDIGKNVCSKKIKKKPPSLMIKNGSLIFDKRKGDVRRGVSSSAKSSSSSEASGFKSLFLASTSEKGGCSREPSDEMGGLIPNRPKRVSFNLSSGPISSKPMEGNICVDLGPLVVNPMMRNGFEMRTIPELDSVLSSNDSEATKDALVVATIAAEKKKSSMAVGDRVVTEDNEFLSSDKSESVDMEKSRDSDVVVANSEEDIVHAPIAAGIKDIVHAPIAAGIKQAQVIRQSSKIKSKGSSSHNMRTRNAKYREAAEIEAAEVIAIGSVLGLDFSEANEEVLEEITRREEEDLANHEVLSSLV